ncbi:MAG: hypothetical protein ACI8ZM_001690 [Crocinitomix sp.]|jgi:hypothetical protein
MKKIFTLFAIAFLSAPVIAQEFATIYQPHNPDEHIVVRDVSVTSDNMILAGYDIAEASMPPSAGIMKLDIDGNVIWSNRLDIADSQAGCTFEVLENADGNYYLWGLSKELETGDMRAILTEMTPSGDILWSKEYDFGWNTDYAYTVNKLYVLPSGDLQMMIAVYSKVIVMQTDADGNIIWGKQSTVGPPDEGGKNPGFEWLVVPDDGGMCASKAENDFSLLRYNADGDLMWARRYDSGAYTHGKTIQRSPNGNILVGGFIAFYPIIMEISDEDGSINWVRTIGGGPSMEYGSMAQINVIGDDVIFDYSTNTGEHFILKMDENGEISNTYRANSATIDYDKLEFTDEYSGFFYGSFDYESIDPLALEGMIYKANDLLEPSCVIVEVEPSFTSNEWVSAVDEVPFTPTQLDYTNQEDIEITMVAETMTTAAACGNFSGIIEKELHDINLYPNPASNSLNLIVSEELLNTRVEIIDVTGKTVMRDIISSVNQLIDLSELREGQYILAIQGENELITKKITVIK